MPLNPILMPYKRTKKLTDETHRKLGDKPT